MNEHDQADELQRPAEPGPRDENLDESLADVPPAPLLGPSGQAVVDTMLKTGVVLAAGAGALFLFSVTMAPCAGATRSAKLKWAERQRLIEQAERNAKPAATERG